MPRLSLDFPSARGDGDWVAFRGSQRRMLPGQLAVNPRRTMSGTATWADLAGSLRSEDATCCALADAFADVGNGVDDSAAASVGPCSVGGGIDVHYKSVVQKFARWCGSIQGGEQCVGPPSVEVQRGAGLWRMRQLQAR